MAELLGVGEVPAGRCYDGSRDIMMVAMFCCVTNLIVRLHNELIVSLPLLCE